MAGTLYIVATPIGNLDDMPPRVAATFGAADFVAAEDTRVTMRLLNYLGLKKPMVSYYEHALQKGEGIPDEQGVTGRKHMLFCYTPKVIKPLSTNVSVIHFPTRIISEKCLSIMGGRASAMKSTSSSVLYSHRLSLKEP